MGEGGGVGKSEGGEAETPRGGKGCGTKGKDGLVLNAHSGNIDGESVQHGLECPREKRTQTKKGDLRWVQGTRHVNSVRQLYIFRANLHTSEVNMSQPRLSGESLEKFPGSDEGEKSGRPARMRPGAGDLAWLREVSGEFPNLQTRVRESGKGQEGAASVSHLMKARRWGSDEDLESERLKKFYSLEHRKSKGGGGRVARKNLDLDVKETD